MVWLFWWAWPHCCPSSKAMWAAQEWTEEQESQEFLEEMAGREWRERRESQVTSFCTCSRCVLQVLLLNHLLKSQIQKHRPTLEVLGGEGGGELTKVAFYPQELVKVNISLDSVSFIYNSKSEIMELQRNSNRSQSQIQDCTRLNLGPWRQNFMQKSTGTGSGPVWPRSSLRYGDFWNEWKCDSSAPRDVLRKNETKWFSIASHPHCQNTSVLWGWMKTPQIGKSFILLSQNKWTTLGFFSIWTFFLIRGC